MRHRRRGEAPQDRVHRLDFFQRHGMSVVIESEEVAHIDRVARMLHVAVLLVERIAFAPIGFARALHGVLQRFHRCRIVSVQFAFALELVEAGAVESDLTPVPCVSPL